LPVEARAAAGAAPELQRFGAAHEIRRRRWRVHELVVHRQQGAAGGCCGGYFDDMLESDLLVLSLNQSLSQANEIVKFLINVATIMLNLDYAHDQRFERLSTLLMLSVIE